MIHDCRMPNLEPALDASHPDEMLHSMPAQCDFMYLHPELLPVSLLLVVLLGIIIIVFIK